MGAVFDEKGKGWILRFFGVCRARIGLHLLGGDRVPPFAQQRLNGYGGGGRTKSGDITALIACEKRSSAFKRLRTCARAR